MWCTICGIQLNVGGHRLNESIDNISLEEMLRFCTGDHIESQDSIPSSICSTCKRGLCEAYKLILLYLKTRERWSEITTKGTKSDSTKEKFEKLPPSNPKASSQGKEEPLYVNDRVITLKNTPNDNRLPKCCGCYQEFGTFDLLKTHSDCTHKPSGDSVVAVGPQGESEGKFTCDICYRRYKTRRILIDHKQRPYRTKQYQCARCGKSFRDRSSLDDHERLHEGDRPFTCTVCAKTFALKDSYRKHQRLHTVESDRFKCDICGKGCRTKGNLKDHYITHSETDRPLQCPRCDSRFTRKSCLQSHIRLHTGEKPYECGQCNARYMFSSDLRRHVMAHKGIKPFVCNICQRAYPRKDYLMRHVTSSHPDHGKPESNSCVEPTAARP